MRIQPLVGDPLPAEIIVSLASSGGAGTVLIRVRDRSDDERLELMLHDLIILAGPSESLIEVDDAASRAVEIVAAAWRAGASLAILEAPTVSRSWPDRARRRRSEPR